MVDKDKTPKGLGIGAISKATGIPVETIRTWERRYGFPNPSRTESGHRVYASDVINSLRLIDAALKSGMRPSKVVGKSDLELRELLGITDVIENVISIDPSQDDDPMVKPWVEAVMSFDGEELDRLMQVEWARLGPRRFLDERVTPFLHAVGMAWFESRAEIANEHFATERLRDFLTTKWRPISDANSRGPRILCANLPQETHNLGLQIAATSLAFAGCKVIFLGANTPVSDIAHGARSSNASAVVVSISVTANPAMTSRALVELQNLLEPDIELIVGGLGAPARIEGVRRLVDLDELTDWATEVSAKSSANNA